MPEPAPFLSRHGAQIWGLWIFPVIEITVVRRVRMSPTSSCSLNMKINTSKTLHGVRRSWTHLFLRVGKNWKTPNLIPLADDAVTWGGIRGLGSPVYICGQQQNGFSWSHNHICYCKMITFCEDLM